MDAWAKMMVQLVNTDAYADATGKMLDVWLSNSAPLRKLLDSAMAQIARQSEHAEPGRCHAPGRAVD